MATATSTPTNGQAQAVNMLPAKIEAMKNMLASPNMQEQLKNALQDSAPSFVASVLELYSGDRQLQECQPAAVVMQAMKAAILKLPLIKSLGFGYLIVFKNKGVPTPTFIPGYKGLIQLAMRTSQYRIINADKVFEGEYRSKNKLTGEFDLGGEATSEKVIGYFAHFEMLNGFSKTFYMTTKQADDHGRRWSKSYHTDNSIWKTDFPSMALKTVIRGLLSHWGYLSVEMQSALTEDDIDIADKTLQEIQQNGNLKPMHFDGVEEAHIEAEENNFQNGDGPSF